MKDFVIQASRASIATLPLLLFVSFIVYECAEYSKEKLRYRSGEAYYDCVQSCGGAEVSR